MLETPDFELLYELQQNCRRPISQIARRLGRPIATVRDRVRRLEEMGVIRGYSADIDPVSLGYSLLAVIQVSVGNAVVSPEEFFEALGKIPEVENVKLVTGDYEALVTVRMESIEHLRRIVYEDILRVPSVTRTNTSVVLKEHSWFVGRAKIGTSAGLPAEPP